MKTGDAERELIAQKKVVGKRIKDLRKSKGLTQEQLAGKAGLSSKYLSRVELGLENPTIELFIKISGALRVQLSEMFTCEHENKTPEELKRAISSLLNNAGQEKLKMAARIVQTILR